MPRIIYVLIFLFLTIIPFFIVKTAEILLNVTAPVENVSSNDQTTNTGYHSGYYHRPYYGGFFYYGSRGRGGWLGSSYRRSVGTSSSGGFLGGSRSYSGGSSSFKGGGFGSFGK